MYFPGLEKIHPGKNPITKEEFLANKIEIAVEHSYHIGECPDTFIHHTKTYNDKGLCIIHDSTIVGEVTHMDYDKFGRMIFEQIVGKCPTYYRYLEDTDLPVAVVEINLETNRILESEIYIYDKDRNLIQEINSLGTVMNYKYDEQGRCIHSELKTLYSECTKEESVFIKDTTYTEEDDVIIASTTCSYPGEEEVIRDSKTGAIISERYTGERRETVNTYTYKISGFLGVFIQEVYDIDTKNLIEKTVTDYTTRSKTTVFTEFDDDGKVTYSDTEETQYNQYGLPTEFTSNTHDIHYFYVPLDEDVDLDKYVKLVEDQYNN